MGERLKFVETIINKCDEGTWRNGMVTHTVNSPQDFEKLRWK